MSATYSLELYQPHDPQQPNRPQIVPPPEVPRSLPEAGRLLNHAILLAEIWGQEVQPVLDTITFVEESHEGVLQAYDEEDVVVVRQFVGQIVGQLRLALDEFGRPRGEAGLALSRSPLIQPDLDGRLAFKSHRLPLETLLDGLTLFFEMLTFAQTHHLWLRLV